MLEGLYLSLRARTTGEKTQSVTNDGTSKCIDSTLFDVQAYVVHNQHNVMSKQNAKTLKETKADVNKSLLVQVTIEEY